MVGGAVKGEALSGRAVAVGAGVVEAGVAVIEGATVWRTVTGVAEAGEAGEAVRGGASA